MSNSSNLEVLFFESCRALLVIEFPEILTVIEKRSLEVEPIEVIETGSFWNGFVGLVTVLTTAIVLGLIYICSFIICNPLNVFAKLKYFMTLSEELSTPPVDHEDRMFEIGQELIQEWQQLFHKAKLIDSMMIKRTLKNQNSLFKNLSLMRRNISRNPLKTAHTSPGNKPIDVVSRVVTTDELLAMKKNLMSAAGKLKFVATRDQPTIVTTEELLKMKQTCNVVEESDC